MSRISGAGEDVLQGDKSGLAGRYATALYQLAEEQKAVDSVAGELKLLRNLIAESQDLRRLLHHPLLKREDQSRAIQALLNKAQMQDLIKRFLGIVAANRRLSLLPDVIEAFLSMLARARGEVTAEVISAQPLTAEQQTMLAASLQATQGGKVAINAKVDPEILGGLIVKLGSRMIDGSLRTKLNKLQFAMKGI